MGNITSLTGPLGAATNYAYDDMGRLISESTSSGGTISYEYNELNLKEKMTNARGQERKYFYDAAGRVTGFVGEEESVSYTYDQNGNVLTVSDSKGTIKREYDALNRVTKCTDVYGKVIRYEYDAVGNLIKLTYPDNTAVRYTYDVNNNLETVTDWANRTTTYSYDVNNKLTGVIKPDGSVTTTVYDDKQRIVSTVEKTACDDVITGFEYVYDTLGRIEVEKNLAKNIQLCYTYDSLSRVTNRTVKNLSGNVIEQQSYSYDAAGNCYCEDGMCGAVYDINNRLTSTTADHFTYDEDGNLTAFSYLCVDKILRYDSSNRLTYASMNNYTYNAEDTRIRLEESDGTVTEYTYNTNCKLSQLLTKTTNGTTTKYVYGLGLIGEAKGSEFKTYHFDYRGSTVALTDANGNITDTFEYDTYGLMTNHQGTSNIIFGYNGRDGVITDNNGLLYMRARYYFPQLKRFINADILHGEISDSTSLNRYSYVNGNPVSYVDPFGLLSLKSAWNKATKWVSKNIFKPITKTGKKAVNKIDDVFEDIGNSINNKLNDFKDWAFDTYDDIKKKTQKAAAWVDDNIVEPAEKFLSKTGRQIKDWDEEIGQWLDRNVLNKDGSYALYDNQRFRDSVFHEQILAFTPSGQSWNWSAEDISVGLGSVSVDAITGGWEGEHVDLSLFDFGHAEVGAEIKNGNIRFGAIASIWSPSFSFEVFGINIELGAEVGAAGAGFKTVNNAVTVFGALGFGGSVTFSFID